MRVPFEWIKEYVSIRGTPEALAQRLTMAGTEVVGIERVDGQVVFDVDITPNRPDCLSVIGLAREVAAITGRRFTMPTATRGTRRRATAPTIRIEDAKGCSRYIGRVIQGVQVGPSPDWMQRRLLACGVRPINVLVDITNYVLLESGQPLHAFDFDRLAGGTIIVRRARSQEQITTLDQEQKTLSRDTLVIADATQAVAIAGVIGGVGSAVTDRTTTVLLESAVFDPIAIRRTARRLRIATESSYRFERGVDPEGVERASARAAQLMVTLAGGTLRAVRDVGIASTRRSTITVEMTQLNRWLGTSVSPATTRKVLTSLGCGVRGSGTRLRVIPPSFRGDLTQPVDVYEEVARLVGYEQIPSTLPAMTMGTSRSQAGARYARLQSLRCVCASLGLTEAMTWSLISAKDLERCGMSPASAVRVANPLSQDHAYLRPSLVVGLLSSVRRNFAQGASGVSLYEVGNVVERNGRAREVTRLGVMLSGVWLHDWHTAQYAEFFRLKGLIERLGQQLCAATVHTRAIEISWAQPNTGVALLFKSRVVGLAGQVARTIAEGLDIPQDVWFAELDVDELRSLARPTVLVTSLSHVPPVKRDLSIVLEDAVTFEAVMAIIREVGGQLASSVQLVDRYTGTQIPSGKHSLTFAIEYRDPSRTLTAAEADALHRRISETLTSRLRAKLRE